MEKGLVHVYTGDGKGKTTAALGLAIRSAGWGKRVLIIQFLKGKLNLGEKMLLNKLSDRIKIISFGIKEMVNPLKPKSIDYKEAEKALNEAEKEIKSGNWDLMILDEINVALKFGLVPLKKVIMLIKTKPLNLEFVLTGRWADEKIIQLADYVNEIKEIKHPYKKGIFARKGIEY